MSCKNSSNPSKYQQPIISSFDITPPVVLDILLTDISVACWCDIINLHIKDEEQQMKP